MKHYIISILILTVLVPGYARAAETACPEIRVIPAPKEIKCRNGYFKFSGETVVAASAPGSENDNFAIELLVEEMKAQLKIAPETAREMKPGRTVMVGRAADPAMAKELKKHGVDPREAAMPEGYILSISKTSVLAAGADDDGVFHAVQTLRQLLRTEAAGGQLRAMRIDDWPSFSYRGVMDDVSRGPVPTMDTIKQTIRRLSEMKINKFNFYIEHVFEFRKHPDIGPEGGALTAVQIKEIEDYARKYHIELVGGLQSFGHMYHVLKHKKYSHLAENPFNPWEISPARKESYEFLADLYSEIAPAFSSELFNISCDETWSLGRGAARKMVEEKGISWVYAYHINKVHKLLSGHGKRIMMWADIALKHPDIIDMLPTDIILLPWNYSARDSFDDMLLPTSASGHDFIVCPGVSCWGRLFPNTKTALANIGNFARDGGRFHARGLMNTAWDDSGENLFAWNWFPLAWGAEVSWNPLPGDSGSQDRFKRNFTPVFFGAEGDYAVKGIGYLAQAAEIPEYLDLRDSAYWQWPVPCRSPRASAASADMLLSLAEKAEKQFVKLKETASANRENADYLIFASHRIRDMARRRKTFFLCADKYMKALDYKGGDREKIPALLEQMDSALSSAQSGSSEVLQEYSLLWNRENRPYWFDNNRKKFDALDSAIEKTRAALREAAAEYRTSGVLPPIEKAGLK